MAGIGFELRRVANKGGLSGIAQAAVSGTMIVAGPWIMSIISIMVIQRGLGGLLGENGAVFTSVIVYSYAFSLVLSGGIQYVFTRIVADSIYRKEEGAGLSFLLDCVPWILLLSAVVAVPASLLLRPGLPNLLLFRAAMVFLFMSVNLLWFVMLFISVLTWFLKIILSFAAGMGAGVLLIFLLAKPFGAAGALLGFGIGHFLIDLLLILLCLRAYRPVRGERMKVLFKKYVREFLFLFLTGWGYYLSLWVDKFIYWFSAGIPVPGTLFPVYEPYDISIYFANLTMIPGLVFFIIASETTFSSLLKRFLMSLGRERYTDILKRKYRLRREAVRDLAEQTSFQGIVSAAVILAIPTLNRVFFSDTLYEGILMISCAGVFFHLVFLSLLNFLFYMERYRRAFLLVCVFLGTNAIVSGLSAAGVIPFPPGAGYLSAGIFSAVLGYRLFGRSMKQLDRFIYAGIHS